MKYFRLIIGLVAVSLVLAWTGCARYISKDAKRAFEKRPGTFSVTVFPVNIVRGFSLVDQDGELAEQLARFLIDEGYADAIVDPAGADIVVKRSVSQPKVMKNSAVRFSTIVRERQIRTDYALLVEIFLNHDQTVVRGVHIYLVDREGRVAMIGLNNSHWGEYKAVMPKDRQGGYQVAVRMLRRLCSQD